MPDEEPFNADWGSMRTLRWALALNGTALLSAQWTVPWSPRSPDDYPIPQDVQSLMYALEQALCVKCRLDDRRLKPHTTTIRGAGVILRAND
jgi:hypothetical protein